VPVFCNYNNRRMGLSRMWNSNEEVKFFQSMLKLYDASKLFYLTEEGSFYAYWPKNYKGKKTTLQSRNSFIGAYTEKWLADMLKKALKGEKLFVVHNAICEEIGLDKKTPADIVISKRNGIRQKPEDILLIIEVKMSIVWNYEYNPIKGEVIKIGDFTTHTGNPSLLRSDSMLKAIGKSVNIRIYEKSSHIPIIVIGNTPISKSYYKKVDMLKKSGIIQAFISVNPNPCDACELNVKHTKGYGFIRIDNIGEFKDYISRVISMRKEFTSFMIEKEKLGRYIEIAAKEKTFIEKADKLLNLLRGEGDG